MDTFADPVRVDRAPFVARDRELARLDALLRHRTGGTGPVAVDVVGEPGIGKSRLLAEFAARARRHGATVLRGRAGPAERDQGRPFRAFVDAFADLDHHDRAVSPDLAALAALVESSEPPSDVVGGADVGHIAAALGRVPAAGLVLVLDDFHAADPASVALVDHLFRHPPRAPALLVLARRERQTAPALASVLARAADSGDAARLVLGPLSPDDCTGLLVPGLPPDLARRIHAVSRGNPLYHRALAHARTRRGRRPAPGPWRWSSTNSPRSAGRNGRPSRHSPSSTGTPRPSCSPPSP